MLRLIGSNAVVWTAVFALLASAIDGAIAQETQSPASGVHETPQQALEAFIRGVRLVSSIATLEDKRNEWADRRVQRTIEAVADRVRRNPRLQGGYYQFQANKRLLKESDLERGKTQLRRMLRDRPEMARGLTEEDELFQWAARKFAGEDVPTWIEWQNMSDISDFDAWHQPPDEDTPGQIFVRKVHGPPSRMTWGSAPSFDELWMWAAYEMHNIQSHREFHELWDRALAGTITRDEYILGYARLEYGALLRTRVFFIEIYYPWAKKHGRMTTEDWGLDVPYTFDEWIAHYPRGLRYPWRYYGNAYDGAMVWRELRGSRLIGER